MRACRLFADAARAGPYIRYGQHQSFGYAARVDEPKRKQDEKKFGSWIETSAGGRRYWYEVQGRAGWKARYCKEVDSLEITISFWQEI